MVEPRAISSGDPGVDSAGEALHKGSASDIALVLGTIVSSAPGRFLTHGDCRYIESATRQLLETGLSGQVSEWCNPDTGNSGKVVAFAAEAPGTDEHIRAFQQSVRTRGLSHTATGKARRRSGGNWQLID